MNTVRKFPLPVADHAEIEMPQGASVLSAGLVKAQPCVWALVEEARPPVRRRFRLIATSEPIPDLQPSWKFVGSVTLRSNDCHLWDLGESRADRDG